MEIIVMLLLTEVLSKSIWVFFSSTWISLIILHYWLKFHRYPHEFFVITIIINSRYQGLDYLGHNSHKKVHLVWTVKRDFIYCHNVCPFPSSSDILLLLLWIFVYFPIGILANIEIFCRIFVVEMWWKRKKPW